MVEQDNNGILSIRESLVPKVRKENFMELLTKKLHPNCNIFLMSDIHEGTTTQSKTSLELVKDMVLSSKNNYVMIGGDLAEAITIDDKRYDIETVDSRASLPLLQYQNIVKYLKPLKNRIITILLGNHDYKLMKYGNFVKDYVCNELGVPYGTYTVKLAALDKKGKITYKIFFTHGARSISSTADDPIRRESNMLLQLKRRLQHKAGDCEVMAMGHTHRLLVSKPLPTLYLVDDGDQIIEEYTRPMSDRYIPPDHRFYANTGSFLKLYQRGVSGYAERFGYDPTELGFCIIEIRDQKVYDVKKVVL